LNLSLVETRRVDGKVKHEHIAGLGSIATSHDSAARLAFWAHLHERFGELSDRIKSEALTKILGDIHARVPMVTVEEKGAIADKAGAAANPFKRAGRPERSLERRVARAVLRKHASRSAGR
jgi:hypothetical protein